MQRWNTEKRNPGNEKEDYYMYILKGQREEKWRLNKNRTYIKILNGKVVKYWRKEGNKNMDENCMEHLRKEREKEESTLE